MATWLMIVAYFDALIINGPCYRFFLEPEKLMVVVKKGYEEATARFFLDYQFQIMTGTQ